MAGHLRVRLRPEVLDDDLLDVPVSLVQVADREQRVDPLLARLADPDQDARRERDPELAGQPEGLQPSGRPLVGRAEVRPTALGEPVGDRLEHDSLRGRDAAEPFELSGAHHARVRVRQEARLGQHELGHPREVVDRRLAAELCQLLPRHPVAALGLVTEREQRLPAPGLGACPRDREHLVRRQVGALSPARRLRERAVVADVAAQGRQRDEDLGRVRHERSLAGRTEPLRRLEQRLGHDRRQRLCVGSAETLAGPGPGKDSFVAHRPLTASVPTRGAPGRGTGPTASRLRARAGVARPRAGRCRARRARPR